MSTVATAYEHIILNDDNIPVIKDTNMKVIELVLEKIAYGWSPEEMHLQHPYLTLGKIYSALAYYSDHHEELDKDIENRLKYVESIKQSVGSSPLIEKLKSKGLI